jgi:DNA-cytosine methyltransferase
MYYHWKELFDVCSMMSCGQIALNKLGIDYDKYFACEIDKYAMQVTQHNFPDTIQLGDVQFVTKETFGTHKIDLVIGGSPCQGFSFAGKQLNFEDPRSALFFEFVRLVKELKPKYFLLENVKMKKEYQNVITQYMGVEPIEINSSLVSAQTRKRLYWTNIPNVSQPEDKGVVLRDIIESGCIDDRMVNEGKSHCLTARYSGAVWWNSIERKQRTMISLEQVDNKLRHKEATKKGYAEAGEGEGLDLTFPESKTRRGRAMKDKSNCLTAAGHEMGVVIDPSKPNQINPSKDAAGKQPYMQDRVFHEDGKSHALTATFANRTNVGDFEDDVKGGAVRGRYNEDGKVEQRLEVRKDDKTNSITTVQKDSIVVRPATIVGRRLNERGVREDYNKDVAITQCLQVKHNSDKSGTLTTVEKDNVLSENEPGRYPDAYNDKKLSWRKLTPLECERLQTVPDGYSLVLDDNGKQLVSDSQRYKMLGNGWTIDVITHIMKNMEL